MLEDDEKKLNFDNLGWNIEIKGAFQEYKIEMNGPRGIYSKVQWKQLSRVL